MTENLCVALHRRSWLRAVAASTLATLAGCGCPKRDHPSFRTSEADAAEILADRRDREELLQRLAGLRTEQNATFATLPRPVKVLDAFPSLKPLQRLAHRLHPRPSDTAMSPAESSLGGPILWPEGDPWPECETFGIPYTPVLQLRLDDSPPPVKFKPGSDLFQLLWSPRKHGQSELPKPLAFWRKAKECTPANPPPASPYAMDRFVPIPCRLHPEPVLEFPDWATAKVTPFRQQLEAWKAPGGADPVVYYRKNLSTAPGTKIGGYPNWLRDDGSAPTCTICRRGLDFLLTIDGREWRTPSWIPASETELAKANSDLDGLAGLRFADRGNLHLFVCRRCDDWPIQLTR